jgi:hypothetical protein
MKKGFRSFVFFELVILFLLNSCSNADKKDLIVRKWCGDTSFVDTAYPLQGHALNATKEEILKESKEEISYCHMEFLKDSTCVLNFGTGPQDSHLKYKIVGDTLFIFDNDHPSIAKWKIASLTNDELKIIFTIIMPTTNTLYSYIIKFKPIEAGPDSSISVNNTPSPSDDKMAAAQNDFQQKIASTNGAVTLDQFTKTNGYDQDYSGMKMYVLEWQATFTVQRELWKIWNMLEGNWHDFDVTITPANNQSFQQLTHFPAGKKVHLTGKYTLLKTDNG